MVGIRGLHSDFLQAPSWSPIFLERSDTEPTTKKPKWKHQSPTTTKWPVQRRQWQSGQCKQDWIHPLHYLIQSRWLQRQWNELLCQWECFLPWIDLIQYTPISQLRCRWMQGKPEAACLVWYGVLRRSTYMIRGCINGEWESGCCILPNNILCG